MKCSVGVNQKFIKAFISLGKDYLARITKQYAIGGFDEIEFGRYKQAKNMKISVLMTQQRPVASMES